MPRARVSRGSQSASVRYAAGKHVTKVPEVELATLPKIAPSDLRLLWVNDWYDGPLEAVVEHASERCLMVLHHEDASAEQPYSWLVIRLSAEQQADEDKWHALYVQHVGEHWCFHGPTVAHPRPEPEPEPDAERFFGALRTRPTFDLAASTVVGWADEMPAR